VRRAAPPLVTPLLHRRALTPPPQDLSSSSSTPPSEICCPHPRLLHRVVMSSAPPLTPVADPSDAAAATDVDVDVRWNAIYLMLKHVVSYKRTFSVFISANYPTGGESLLTDDHWYVIEHMLKFLGLFYISTVSLSGVYYPTSHLMMHVIIEIADHLNQFENDNGLREVVVTMKTKFIKY
jgi:hypothetical protein